MSINNFFTTPAGSLVKLFCQGAAPLIIDCLVNNGGLVNCIVHKWEAYTTAGIIMVLIVGYNYLNPKDSRYGKNKDISSNQNSDQP